MTTLVEPKPVSAGVYRPYPQEIEDFRKFQRMPLLLWRLGLASFIGRWLMVLTTVGRKSGQPRHSMVSYYKVDGKKYVYSGFGPRSDWYRNLLAHPGVTLQTADGVESAVARRVTDPTELYTVLSAIQKRYPASASMLEENWGEQPLTPEAVAVDADRFYMVAFEPTDRPTPNGLEEDLRWARPLVMIVVVGLLATLVATLVSILARARRSKPAA